MTLAVYLLRMLRNIKAKQNKHMLFRSSYSYIRAFFQWDHMSLVVRKPVLGVSDQVRHKRGCTTTEDVLKLEISDLGSRGILLSV